MIKFDNPDMELCMKSMGKYFRVTAIFGSTDEANAYLETNPGQGVIAEDHQGWIYIAEDKPSS